MPSSRRWLVRISIAAALTTATLTPSAAAESATCTQTLLAPKTGTLVAECMTGDQVLPPPGDPDGSGTATIWIDMNTEQIAWDVDTEMLEPPLRAAMVHEAPEGETGLVEYIVFENGEFDLREDVTGCDQGLDPEVRDLLQKSADFYLEIRDSGDDQPADNGAIRGQLKYVDKNDWPDFCTSTS
ncbi:MAG: CHRD domain-containing protein [Propionibacteriales bacterium]|nr:CHRD domain-containing protein [Propionibacteriales bacterium]